MLDQKDIEIITQIFQESFKKGFQEGIKPIQEEIKELRDSVKYLEESSEENSQRIYSMQNDLEAMRLRHESTKKQLEDITLNIKIAERGIRTDIRKLQDGQDTLITILEERGLLPKMN